MFDDNIMLLTDSYKVSHWRQYPPGTQKVYSYFESRGGEWGESLVFGMQYLIKEYLMGQVVTEQKLQKAKKFWKAHFFGDDTIFNEAGWRYILEKHNGKLPILIKCVPEGEVVPTRNVLFTIENTDPECYWLPSWLETLLVQRWYPFTTGTLSREIKKIILKYLRKNGTPSLVDFKLHDFGFRGVSSCESAAIGGAAHLINFSGTDTSIAITLIQDYYADEDYMPGFSIPAAEHSTITSWGQEREIDAYRNMLKQFPKGFVAVVSDSYDIFNACTNLWGDKLKSEVLARDGTLVIRPDSGDPLTVVLDVLNLLGEKFGFKLNDKGYRVLNDKVRVIQGDGINITSLEKILDKMDRQGWSADNIAFGSGGGLLQQTNRDTQKYALKCSEIQINGEFLDVFKEPITDKGKVSKKGSLVLLKDSNGKYVTCRKSKQEEFMRLGHSVDQMVNVFENGILLNPVHFEQIRKRANNVI